MLEHNHAYQGFGPRADGMYPLRRARMGAELPDFILELLPDIVTASEQPFVGVTTDGTPVSGMFPLDEDRGFDPGPAVAAAEAFLATLSPTQQTEACYPVDAAQWRRWTNAYPLWTPHGLFLDDLDGGQRAAALRLVEACLSARGFTEARTAMKLNAALGELIGQYRDTLVEYAYFFAVFGTPSSTAPWGWQLWGHHLDISCFILGRHLVLTPAFLGAEPVTADGGTHRGLRLFDAERSRALDLRRALTSAQAETAVLHRSMLSADLPPDLVNFVDGRTRAGAGQDNRVLPYEGLPADRLNPGQRRLLRSLLECYVGRMPAAPARAVLSAIARHLDETYLAWIGGAGDADAFYYKIHSPVILIEFDNHQGVFLDNEEPQPFHVHSIVRTPNGGDYGADLLRQHYAGHHTGKAAY
jgi:hypothetical protein